MALSGSFSGSIRDGKYVLRVDWSATQSVANNTSKITCVMYLVQATNFSLYISGRSDNTTTIAGTSYTWSSPAINNGGGKTTKMATVTSGNISHNADGTKSVTISAEFNVRATISGTYYSKITASATITLDTIPRATQPVLSASSANMGSKVTISLPRASDSFTHDLAYAFAGSGYTNIATGVGTSYTWKVPDKASSIPNSLSGTMTVRCITKNGGTVIGTKTAIMTAKVPPDAVPTISSVSVAEAVSGLAAQFGAYIQGKSKVAVTITASGAKGSTIAAYSSTLQGASFTTRTWTSGFLTASGTLTIVTRVKDSRGRWSSAKNTNITVLAYERPKITAFTAYRANSSGSAEDDGVYLAVNYAYTVPTLNGGNTAAMVVEYKQSTDTTWNTVLTGTALSANTTAKPSSPTFSTDYQYDLRVTVTDWFGEYGTLTTILPSGAVILDLSADGKGLAFGKTAEQSGVDFGWSAKGAVLGLWEATAEVPENGNLNDYNRPGVYSTYNNARVATLSNCPSTKAGVLRVWTGIGTARLTGAYVYIMQEYRSYDAAEPTYIRLLTTNASGVWSYGAWMSDGARAMLTSYGTATTT